MYLYIHSVQSTSGELVYGCCAVEVLCVVVMIIRGLHTGCAGGLTALPPWSRCGPVVAGVRVCCEVLESHGAVVAQWWLGSVYAVKSWRAMEPLWPSGGWGQSML